MGHRCHKTIVLEQETIHRVVNNNQLVIKLHQIDDKSINKQPLKCLRRCRATVVGKRTPNESINVRNGVETGTYQMQTWEAHKNYGEKYTSKHERAHIVHDRVKLCTDIPSTFQHALNKRTKVFWQSIHIHYELSYPSPTSLQLASN